MEVELWVNEKMITVQAAMIVIANATRYGTGALINPNGSLEDALFEVIVVKKISLSQLFKMMVTHQPYNTLKKKYIKPIRFK